MINKHGTFPKFCQLLNTQWILVSEDPKITAPTPQSGGSAMLHETWRHFLPQQFSLFQTFFAHVKSLCLLLHGAAGSQPWRKFKPCGLEHASSCQKNPNLSVPGPFCERGFGQSNQSLTTSQCKPDSQDGGLSLRSLAQLLIHTVPFHKVSAAWTLSLIGHDPPQQKCDKALWTWWPDTN